MKTMFFAPHPDDETFACGGTIALKTDGGEEVVVVFMTDGRNSHRAMGIEENPSPDELIVIRKGESQQAASILGVKKENLIFLGFEDIFLYEGRKEAQRMVSEILAAHKPDSVFIPARNEFHPDHISTNLIVSRSIKKLGIGPLVYEYSVIPTGEPRAAMETMVVDIGITLERKKRAIKVYKSQIDIISPKQTHPMIGFQLLTTFMGDRERFLRVR